MGKNDTPNHESWVWFNSSFVHYHVWWLFLTQVWDLNLYRQCFDASVPSNWLKLHSWMMKRWRLKWKFFTTNSITMSETSVLPGSIPIKGSLHPWTNESYLMHPAPQMEILLEWTFTVVNFSFTFSLKKKQILIDLILLHSCMINAFGLRIQHGNCSTIQIADRWSVSP